MADENRQPRWWGEFELAPRQTARWDVGTLTVWVERGNKEWRVAWQRGIKTAGEIVHQQCNCPEGIPAGIADFSRFGFRRTQGRLRLLPLLADRPVISRPDHLIVVPPGEEITLYVSSPLWLGIEAGEPARLLCDFPVERPSDTWFGSPVKDGGLCYAAVTRAHTDLDEFDVSLFRAVTPVVIRNRAKSRLPIERLNLPVPFLSLYQAKDGSLWTEGVSLEHEEGESELAVLSLDKGIPAETGSGMLLSGPRNQAEKNLVFQAFSRIFL